MIIQFVFPAGWFKIGEFEKNKGTTGKNSFTLFDWAVPKLSSSEAVSVVIFPVTPEIWNRRSPRSWTELNLATGASQVLGTGAQAVPVQFWQDVSYRPEPNVKHSWVCTEMLHGLMCNISLPTWLKAAWWRERDGVNSKMEGLREFSNRSNESQNSLDSKKGTRHCLHLSNPNNIHLG